MKRKKIEKENRGVTIVQISYIFLAFPNGKCKIELVSRVSSSKEANYIFLSLTEIIYFLAIKCISLKNRRQHKITETKN